MPYHYYKPRGPDECVTYIQNESSRRGNHHRFITEKQVFARWAKQYNIIFTHPKWWQDFLRKPQTDHTKTWKTKETWAGLYFSLPQTGLWTAPNQRQLLSGTNTKKHVEKNILWDQKMERSENVFLCKRGQNFSFWEDCPCLLHRQMLSGQYFFVNRK